MTEAAFDPNKGPLSGEVIARVNMSVARGGLIDRSIENRRELNRPRSAHRRSTTAPVTSSSHTVTVEQDGKARQQEMNVTIAGAQIKRVASTTWIISLYPA